jgi:lipopolysaccharide/colanic/teichoic acid biosynthesis glycosyltransferase
MLRTRQYVLALGDFIMLLGALVGMVALRFGQKYDMLVLKEHLSAFVPLFLIWLAVFFVFNLYDIRSVNPNPRNIGRLGLAMAAAIVLGGFFFYIQPQIGISPRTNLLIVSLSAFVLLILWRRLCYILFASVFSRRIMLVGASPELAALATHIGEQVPLGRIVRTSASTQALGENETIADVDLLITDATDPKDIVRLEHTVHTRVLTLPEAYAELFARIPLALMTDAHATRIAVRARNYSYTFVTRVFEVLIAGAILVVASPFVLIAGIAKMLEDGGPAFLPRHLRVGQDGRPFALQKMRSMVVDAEAKGIKWTEHADPRITRVGRIIRKLHLDEVPQLWNVIRGDMSLVGPRPEQPEFVVTLEREVPYYFLRHVIKPGFTGWAQIKFRYARTVSDSGKKLEYDLYYLENRSPLLDLGILLKTVQIIFTH